MKTLSLSEMYAIMGGDGPARPVRKEEDEFPEPVVYTDIEGAILEEAEVPL